MLTPVGVQSTFVLKKGVEGMIMDSKILDNSYFTCTLLFREITKKVDKHKTP